MARLTRKRKVFIEEYIQCWNGAEAARRAGYKHARNQASFLLAIPNIQEAIKARIAEKAMSADEVLLRLGAQARGNLADFVSSAGVIDWRVVKKKGELIKSINHTAGKQSRIELYDAQAALVHLGKHHRLFVDQQEIVLKSLDLSTLSIAQLERISAGEDVLSVLATPGGR